MGLLRLRDRGVEIKTPDQIALMRRAGRIVGETLQLCRDSIQPGMTADELDRLAETYIRDHEAIPSFKGYLGYPATACVSINAEVVHNRRTPLAAVQETRCTGALKEAVVAGPRSPSPVPPRFSSQRRCSPDAATTRTPALLP